MPLLDNPDNYETISKHIQMNFIKHIYLDHCATTPVHPEVMEEMIPFFSKWYGNPSSIHAIGRKAREALNLAREKVAALISASPDEIVFTSGGTEADNFAVRGGAYAGKKKKNHIITTAIEHHAVLNTCKYLEGRGFEITYLPVDHDGLVNPDDVAQAITDRTMLVSIMHGNNEIGTIEPIEEIAYILRQADIVFHTDAVQTVGKMAVNVNDLGVDMMTMSSHKIYGPKGIGALYIRKGTKIVPILYGGHQEQGLRHGTENVAAVVGFGKACEIAAKEYPCQMKNLKDLRDDLEARIIGEIEDAYLNGSKVRRLPHILNISIAGLEAESIIRELDKKGIAVSAGSACTSDSVYISHVISALNIPRYIAKGSLRFSLGRDNILEDIDYTANMMTEVVTKLRGMAEIEASLGRRGCV